MANEANSKSGPYPWDEKMSQDTNVLLNQIAPAVIDFEVVDISTGHHVSTMKNCRYMTCTSGTIIKVNVVRNVAGVATEYTSGITVPAEPRFIPVSNVTQVYSASATDAANIILWK